MEMNRHSLASTHCCEAALLPLHHPLPLCHSLALVEEGQQVRRLATSCTTAAAAGAASAAGAAAAALWATAGLLLRCKRMVSVAAWRLQKRLG